MTPEVLNFAQACALLGLSQPALRKIVRAGGIPCRKTARQILFRRETLLAWVDGKDTTDEAPPADPR